MLFSKIIRKNFDVVLGRYDGNKAFYYFSPEDFPEIKKEAFDAEGDNGITLKGFLYYYGEVNPSRFVIFDHGIGAGHLAYFKEIEYLARKGYTVYSYDHTGCVNTEGSGIMGFGQGVNDLDHAVASVKKDARFAGKAIKVIGHSWGAYSAMNAAQYHEEITHVVSLSGFLSAKALIEQYLPKFVKKYSSEVMDRERRHNPKYADLDARESLMKSDCKLLHLQSTDDMKVKYELSYEPLYAALKDRPGTEFISCEHKNHDPQRTENACKANLEMLTKFDSLLKSNSIGTQEQRDEFKNSFDWNLIYEQDEEVWAKILEFLDK